jgi:Tol biopolymer transport system component
MGSANPKNTTAAFAGQLNNNNSYNQEDNQIWRLNARGYALQVDPGPGRSPWWHPDGTYIAFESKRSGNGYGIYTIFPDGKHLKGPYTDATIDANHPKFSPDGTKMVFSAKDKIGGNWCVAVMDPWPPP